ncbi:MAG: GntR family transcriptional regulator [Synergistaceae bacterium]|nr:GntR family transcriptional regulator [Synergistaceae bacterium]
MQLLDSVKLDKNVPIPLYYQLKSQVLAMIGDGVLHEGDILPPENELCAALDVSRPTIRQAFSELVAEGYLNRYKGRGTFVSKPKLDARFLSKLETFNGEMASKGLEPRTAVLALERMFGPCDANERLNIPLNEPLIYLSRIRYADGVPLVYVETFIPYERYKRLMDVDLGENSLYDSLEKLYGVRVNRAEREIEAVNAKKSEADLLRIEKNKAISLVKTVAYSDGLLTPVEFSVARYRGDLNKFSVVTYR